MKNLKPQNLIVEKIKAKKLTVAKDDISDQGKQTQKQFIILDYKLSDNAKNKCYLGLVKNTRERVAVKIIYNTKASKDISGCQQFVQKCQRQLNNLYKASQQFKPSQFSSVSNIVYVYPFIYHSQQGTHAYIFMEFCQGGDLQAEIKVRRINGKWFSFGQLYNIFKQLLNGYDQLYRCLILHQDLKPANILINDGVLKIGNFGLSYKLGDLNDNVRINGSPYYTAPEKYSPNYTPTTASDIFSLGVIMYELIFDESPYWQKKQNSALKSKIVFKDWIKQKKTFDEQLHKQAMEKQLDLKLNFNRFCKNAQQEAGMKIMLEIVQRMLQKDPSKRITFEQMQLQFQKLSLLKTQLINFMSQKFIPQKLNYIIEKQSHVKNEPLKFSPQQLSDVKIKNPSLYVIRKQSEQINVLSNLLLSIMKIIQIQIRYFNINDENIKNLCTKLLEFNYCLTYTKYYEILTEIAELDKDNLMSFYNTNIDYFVNNTKNNQQYLQSLILGNNLDKTRLNSLLELQKKQIYAEMAQYLDINIRKNKLKYLDEETLTIYMFIYLLLQIVQKIGYNYTLEEMEELVQKQKQMQLKIGRFKSDQVAQKLKQYGIDFPLIQYQ